MSELGLLILHKIIFEFPFLFYFLHFLVVPHVCGYLISFLSMSVFLREVAFKVIKTANLFDHF